MRLVFPHFGIRTSRYKLIRFYGDGDFWELYDPEKDPMEMKNLHGLAGYGKITKSLVEDLQDLIQKYDDQEALAKLREGK